MIDRLKATPSNCLGAISAALTLLLLLAEPLLLVDASKPQAAHIFSIDISLVTTTDSNDNLEDAVELPLYLAPVALLPFGVVQTERHHNDHPLKPLTGADRLRLIRAPPAYPV